jgi:hypothetical protein
VTENTLVAEIVARLRRNGAVFTLEGKRLRVRPWRSLPAEDRRAVQDGWKSIVAFLRAERAEPAPAPAPEPEPEAEGPSVAECDVLETLAGLGDETLALYQSGRLSRREAEYMARNRLRQRKEFR